MERGHPGHKGGATRARPSSTGGATRGQLDRTRRDETKRRPRRPLSRSRADCPDRTRRTETLGATQNPVALGPCGFDSHLRHRRTWAARPPSGAASQPWTPSGRVGSIPTFGIDERAASAALSRPRPTRRPRSRRSSSAAPGAASGSSGSRGRLTWLTSGVATPDRPRSEEPLELGDRAHSAAVGGDDPGHARGGVANVRRLECANRRISDRRRVRILR